VLKYRYILLSLQKKIMQDILCKKCGGSRCVKSGYIRENQRYKCKDCGCNFKLGDNRGKIKPQAKALGLLLYGSGKASYGMLARLFNVSRSAVLYWVRTMGAKLPEPVVNSEIEEVSIDEMWHFISKKNEKFGSGGQWTAVTTKPSAGLLAIVMLKRLEACTTN
jgi:transposase-like protein